MMYTIMDIETVLNEDIGWKAPEKRPDQFPPPFATRIITIGGMTLEITDDKYEATWLGVYGDNNTKEECEAEIIKDFYTQFNESYKKQKTALVTFNGIRFDIPVLVARMMHYGFPCRLLLEESFKYQYNMEGHIDLLDQISNHGASRFSKLIHICRAIGMPGKVEIDGSGIQRLYDRNRLDLIHSHCQCDIIQTGILLLRYLYTQEAIQENQYNELVETTINLAKEKDNAMLNKAIDLMDSDTLFLPVTTTNKEETDKTDDIPF